MIVQGINDVLFPVDGRWKNAVNMLNPLGSKGNMAKAFATLLHELWHGDLPYMAPYSFRVRFLRHFLIFKQFTISFRNPSVFLHPSLEDQINMIRKSFFRSFLTDSMKT